MGYRDPVLYVHHALRTAGASNVTTSTEESGFGKERLLDDRVSPLFMFDAAATNQHVTVDLGAGWSDTIDTLIIPGGHNLDGISIHCDASATGAFAGEETESLATTVVSGDGPILETLTAGTTLRHHRLVIEDNHRGEFGEVWFTEARTLARGPEPNFSDQPEANFDPVETDGGEEFRTVLGSTRRRVRLRLPYLEAADQAILDDLLTETLDGVRPFWLLPPNDQKEVVHVRVVPGGLDVQNDARAPKSEGIKPGYRLELFESIA